MSEITPLARSAISSAPPVTVGHGWEISGRRSEAELRIMDCSPLAKVLLRAAMDGETARALGVPFGHAIRDEHGTLVVGSAPGEWLLLGKPGEGRTLMRRLEELPAEELVSIFDATHGRSLVRITGPRAADLLGKVCAIDFSDGVTPDGVAFRSSVAKVVTDIVREDREDVRSYLLHCERSSGQYLFDSLSDAGEEFGIEVEGFDLPERGPTRGSHRPGALRR